MIPRRVLTPEFIKVWQRYMAANKAAADSYKAMPSSLHRAVAATRCACGRVTINLGGVCHVCRRVT